MLGIDIVATCDSCQKKERFEGPFPPLSTAANGPPGWFRSSAMGPERACSVACADALQKAGRGFDTGSRRLV
jgi:hypothetical protein